MVLEYRGRGGVNMKNKRSLLGIVATLSLIVANLGAGVTCWGLVYQPEMPKQLRK